MEMLGGSVSVETVVCVVVFFAIALTILLKSRGASRREATGDGAGVLDGNDGDCDGD